MECEAADGTVSLYWLPAKFSKVGPTHGLHMHNSYVPQLPSHHRYAFRKREGQVGLERGREEKRERGRERDREILLCTDARAYAHTCIHTYPQMHTCVCGRWSGRSAATF